VARSDDAETRAARWEKEANDLSTQVAFLQEELALVRRKLTESPRHVRQLEERLAATQAQLARLTENNERLVATLKEARAQIVTLKEEIDRLAQPPDHVIITDGVRGGTCDSGVNSGQSCDVNGSSPNVFFGATSLDCPPTSGAQIAALPIDLSNSTGTVSRTLATSTVLARSVGLLATAAATASSRVSRVSGAWAVAGAASSASATPPSTITMIFRHARLTK